MSHAAGGQGRTSAPVSQQYVGYGVQQGHVLCPFDGKLAYGVVVDHLWDRGKRLTELTQDEFVISVYYFHMHKPTSTPEKQEIHQCQ